MIPKVHDFNAQGMGQLTVADLSLLALIADGTDSSSELVQVSGIPERTVYKRLRVLCGDSWIQDGRLRVTESPALVQTRNHPHQRGKQLFLTRDGREFLRAVAGLIKR